MSDLVQFIMILPCGSSIAFDTTASSVFALEYENNLKNNMSWAVEYISYQNEYAAGTGTADSTHIMFNFKKYFNVSRYVQPFVGAGLGASTVTLGGVGVGSGGGLGVQAMAGIKFPFKTVSLILEYKVISANPDDSAGTSVDISSNGVFAGIGFNF